MRITKFSLEPTAIIDPRSTKNEYSLEDVASLIILAEEVSRSLLSNPNDLSKPVQP
jgi:hypothetical protein